MAKGQYQIPFDQSGNQLHYPFAGSGDPITWRDNSVFGDVLIYKGYCRGRSAAYFEFTRNDGTKACMFLKDMEGAIPLMVRGVLAGSFTFVKRGQNYGIAVAQEDGQ